MTANPYPYSELASLRETVADLQREIIRRDHDAIMRDVAEHNAREQVAKELAAAAAAELAAAELEEHR